MKRVFKIDSDGFYLEPVILQDNDKTPIDCVEIEPTGSFIKGKFTNGVWEETATQQEIADLKNVPQPVSELEELKKNQELMQAALDDLLLGGGL
jgi:hypothetical protein